MSESGDQTQLTAMLGSDPSKVCCHEVTEELPRAKTVPSQDGDWPRAGERVIGLSL